MARDLKFTLQIDLEGDEAAVRRLDGTRVAVGRVGDTADSTATAQIRGAEAARQQESAFGGLSQQARVLGGALAALGIVQLGRQLFEVNAQAQSSQAALRTLTGSVSEAAIVWERLLDFASQTPFSLDQSIDAFRALKSRGLDPGIEALGAYADFAAAMGRDLTQFVEAVADAATGQMERLKEFGVTASQQGDKIAFTFGGVTTVVERNAQAVEAFLQKLSRENFAGAAAAQMDTLSGQASNLGDNITKLALAFGKAGANDLFAGVLRSVSSAVESLTANVEDLVPIITIVGGALGTRLVTAAAAGAVQMLSTASAAGVLRGALALLGGPAGIVSLAAGALIGYIASLETTAERTQRLTTETDKLRVGLDQLSRVQAQHRLNQVNAQIQETTDALVGQARLIETLQGQAGKPGFATSAADVTAALAAEEDLQRTLARQVETRRDLQAVVNGTYQAQQDAAEQSAGAEKDLAAAIAATVAAQQGRLAASQAELAAMQQGQAAHAQFLIQREAEKNLAELLKGLGVENIEQLGAEGEALRALALEIATAEAAAANYGKGSKQAHDEAAKAAEQYRQELQRIVDAANPLQAKQRELLAQIALIDQAIGRETGSTRELQRAKEALERQLTALRTPMASVTEAHNKNISALRAELTAIRGGEAAYEDYLAQRRIEEATQQRINDLLAQGHELRQQDKDAIQEQARAEEQLRGEIEREKKAREEANRAWQGFITEIAGAFIDSTGSMGDAFTDLLGRLKRELINSGVAALFGFEQGSTPILSGLGQLFGSGSAASSGGLSTLFSAGKVLPGFEASVIALSNNLVAQGGMLADVGIALNNTANALAKYPGGFAGGAAITAGAGFAGGYLGGKAFGVDPGYGSAIGGTAGAIVGGPVGAAIGSFAGAGIDKLIGGDGPERRAAVFAGSDTSRAEPKWVVDLRDAASGLKLAGEAQRVGPEGEKAVAGLVETFAQIDQVLTSLTRASGLSVDLSGATGFGSFSGQDAARDFVRAWIDAVSEPFDSELKSAADALVGDTAEDLINAYQGLLTIRDSIAAGGIFAGLGSLQQLSQAVGPAQVQQIAAFAAQIKGLQNVMTTDSVAAWEQSQRTVFELWRDQGDAIVNAAEVAASTEDFAVLTAAVQERYATEQQLIGQIMGALQSAADQFGNSYESIFVDGLKTEQERYDFFRQQADAIAEMIATLNDPAAISAAASEYNANLMNAYSSLSEASQDAMRADILATTEQVGALVQERLNMALENIEADGRADVPGSVGNVIEAATDRAMENIRRTVTEAVEAVSQQQAEASRQSTELVKTLNQWAANLPESIRVQIAGSEVAF